MSHYCRCGLGIGGVDPWPYLDDDGSMVCQGCYEPEEKDALEDAKCFVTDTLSLPETAELIEYLQTQQEVHRIADVHNMLGEVNSSLCSLAEGYRSGSYDAERLLRLFQEYVSWTEDNFVLKHADVLCAFSDGDPGFKKTPGKPRQKLVEGLVAFEKDVLRK